MGEAAKATGAGTELEFRGRTYRMADFNLEMIGLMEARLQRRSVEAIERMRLILPEAEFEEWRKATIALIAAGAFAYGSKAQSDFSYTPEGMQYGAFLQLKAHDEDGSITEELVAEMWADCKDKLIYLMQVSSASDPTTAPPETGAGQP
jgi:hypothetical protein